MPRVMNQSPEFRDGTIVAGGDWCGISHPLPHNLPFLPCHFQSVLLLGTIETVSPRVCWKRVLLQLFPNSYVGLRMKIKPQSKKPEYLYPFPALHNVDTIHSNFIPRSRMLAHHPWSPGCLLSYCCLSIPQTFPTLQIRLRTLSTKSIPFGFSTASRVFSQYWLPFNSNKA